MQGLLWLRGWQESGHSASQRERGTKLAAQESKNHEKMKPSMKGSQPNVRVFTTQGDIKTQTKVMQSLFDEIKAGTSWPGPFSLLAHSCVLSGG